MTYPLRWPVGIHTFVANDADEFNNATASFTPPLDEQPGTIHLVYGWQPIEATEPSGAFEERVITGLELLVPPGFPATERDVIDIPVGAGQLLPGSTTFLSEATYPSAQRFKQYRVIGEPRDLTRGPFGFTPGYVLVLKRVEG